MLSTRLFNASYLLVNGQVELVLSGRTPEGHSVCLRVQEYSVDYALLQDLSRYRHPTFKNVTGVPTMPVSRRAMVHNDVVKALMDVNLAPKYRFASRYGGAAFALAELGKEEPNCLSVNIAGRNRGEVESKLNKLRYRIGKLGVKAHETERGVCKEAIQLLRMGLKMYGSYHITGGMMVEAKVSTYDIEMIVEAHHFTECDEPINVSPRTLLFDLEQSAAYNDNFASMSTGEDSVYMNAMMIHHPGNPDHGKKFVIVLNPTLPTELDTDGGHVTIVPVDFRDERSKWRAHWGIVNSVKPDLVGAWNGNTYDFCRSLDRHVAFLQGRVVHPDHPVLPGKIMDLAHLRNMNLPASRFISSVQPMSKFVEVTSVWMNGERNYLPQTPGICFVDIMMAYKTILDPQDGLSLKKCAKAHGVTEKLEFPYHELSITIRSCAFHTIFGDFDPEEVITDMETERLGRLIRAIMRVAPKVTATTIQTWTELALQWKMCDLTRILQLWDAEKAQTKMMQSIDYCMVDVLAMGEIMDDINMMDMLTLYGNLQMLPPDQLVSVGQVKRVHQAYAIEAYHRRYMLTGNWYEKDSPYGGGQVLQPYPQLTWHAGTFVLDYSALYPNIMRARNLCISTHVPDWLEPYLSSDVTRVQYSSHRPTERYIPSRGALELPFASLVPSTGVDQVNFIIDDDALVHTMLHPCIRDAHTVINCDVITDPAAIYQLWMSEPYAATRAELAKKTVKEDFHGFTVTNFSMDSGEEANTIILFEPDYNDRGAPTLKIKKAWLWVGKPVRKLEIIGGKRNHPTFVSKETTIGIIPGVLTKYLDTRAKFKGDMKVAAKEVAKHAETDDSINIEIKSTWPEHLRKAYAYANGAQLSVKVGANSVYGAVGAPGKLYNPWLPMLITSLGRQDIGWLHDEAEKRGRPPVYGDTDSVMPTLPFEDMESGKGFDPLNPDLEQLARMVEEIGAWADNMAREVNIELEHWGCMAATNDGPTLFMLNFYKKKYAYVKLRATVRFFELQPAEIDCDIDAVLDCVQFKGLSVVKSDQTPWGARALGHIICAAIAGATIERLEEIYQYHITQLDVVPHTDLLKTTVANSHKAGAGNDAMRAALRAGEYIATKSRISWAKMKNDEYHTMITAKPTDIDKNWVAEQISKEYQRVLYIVQLRMS